MHLHLLFRHLGYFNTLGDLYLILLAHCTRIKSPWGEKQNFPNKFFRDHETTPSPHEIFLRTDVEERRNQEKTPTQRGRAERENSCILVLVNPVVHGGSSTKMVGGIDLLLPGKMNRFLGNQEI